MRFILLLSLALAAAASSGDRSPPFQSCLASCDTQSCSLPLPLRLTLWSCEDDCKYHCSHVVTTASETRGYRIEQFYGKWAFWRFAGMQEPASVLFSLLNLWAHWRGLDLIKRRVPVSHPMRWYYIAWSVVNCNAWAWSAVFHTRDKPWTEKIDYFSAGLVILSSLYIALIRLFHIYPPPFAFNPLTRLPSSLAPADSRRTPRIILSIVFTLLYIAHISYLGLSERFDYSYNVTANLMVGIIHNLLWVAYSLPRTPFQRFPAPSPSLGPTRVLPSHPKSSAKAAHVVLLTTAATTLEIFDFPPFARTIDAHSLWHLATAAIVPLWYGFLVEDSREPAWSAYRT